MKTTLIVVALLTTLTLAGCSQTADGDPAIYGTRTGGTIQAGVINQAGSSTVLPLAEVWADDFGSHRGVDVRVAGGGSGAGATGLCNGTLDLGDMSREMRPSEHEKCRANNGKDAVQFKVAFDGLSVVVSKKNTFVNDLSTEQLSHIFRAQDPARQWSDVAAGLPARDIRLCYPDSDSGTYEYFNEAILHGGHPRSGNGVQQSANDNVLVTCIENDADAIGYFGYAYLVANEKRLRAVAVDGVAPTPETIADGSYTPLSRPIYIYSSGTPQGLLADYFQYVLHPEGGQLLVPAVGYVSVDEATRNQMLNQLG
jgi:phosphate transport system substrate-binding protein